MNLLSRLKKSCQRNKNIIETISLIFLVVFIFIFFFHRFFIKGELISASSFLYLWNPWAKVRPENLTGIQNYIVSDWVDFHIPSFTYVKNASLKLIASGYNFRSSWGTPSGSIMGIVTIHEPLIMFFIKVFKEELGATLLFISKPVLAFIGATLLFRELKLNKYVSLLCSLSFAFSIPVISFIYGTPITGTVALVFIFYFVVRLSKTLSVKDIVFYVLSTIWLITTGFPSSIMYGVIFSFLLFVFLILTDTRFDTKKKFQVIFFFTIVNLLILGVWAWSIFPNLTNLNGVDLRYREGYGAKKLHGSHFPQWLYPNFCGNATTIPRVCDSNWIETSTSSGIVSLIVLFLGLPAILFKHKNRRFFLYFLFITCFSFFLIFNVGGITEIVAKLPLFSISPSTRLVFLIPLLTTISAGVSFDRIFKEFKNKENRKKIILFWVVVGIVIAIIFSIGFDRLIEHLLLLDRPSFIRDLKEVLIVSVLGLILLLLTLFIKNKIIKKVLLVILSLLAVFDLYFYNSNFLPYLKKEHVFPSTEGIEYLQKNTEPEDRIFAIERVFLPNTNYYYGINSLTGHDWRTKAFNEAMQPIEVGMFDKAGTMQFFSREKVLISSEDLKNYLRFNRVKYIVQNPSSLVPEEDAVFIQPHFSDFIHIEQPIKYIIDISRPEVLEHIHLRGLCNSDSESVFNEEDIRLSVTDEKGELLSVPVLAINSTCTGKNYLEIQTARVELTDNSKINLEILDSKNWKLATYSVRDLRKDTTLEGNVNIYELAGVIYARVSDKEIYQNAYDKGDLLIHAVSENTSTAYFYPCNDLSDEECKNNLKNFKITNPRDLREFNQIFQTFQEVPFNYYKEGEMSFDTSRINERGVIILSDNYFKGWNSKEGEVFQGFLGSMNVFVENPEDSVNLSYTNEYLLMGVIISTLSTTILVFLLFYYRKKGLLSN